MTTYNHQGKQTELVKSAVINYITDHDLQVGDRIPTQSELREMLGVGNAVIGRAVKSLTDAGILKNCGHHGIFVHNREIEGIGGRNIGIICHRDTDFAAAAGLLQMLGIALTNRACQSSFYIKRDHEYKDSFRLREFCGAEYAVNNNLVNGFISLVKLEKSDIDHCTSKGIPICFVGISVPDQYCVNKNPTCDEFLAKAADLGARRPMLIHMGHPYTNHVRKCFLGKKDLFDFGSADPLEYCRFIRENADSFWDLTKNMQKVFELISDVVSLPDEKKPDMLVVPDDILANWIALELNKFNWNPELLHSEIKQFAFSWPLRKNGGCFQVDLMTVASAAVSLLLDLIRGRSPADSNSCDRPIFIERQQTN